MKNFCILLPLTCLIISCGGGGGGGSGESDPPPAQSSPTVTFTASASEIETGKSLTLEWSSVNASSCSASGSWSGSRATSGSEAYTSETTGNYSFSLSCSGSGGSTSKSVSVTFIQAKYDISGTINSLPYSALDGDVPNPNTPVIENDLEPLSIQNLANPSQVIGHLKYIEEETDNDQYDIYSVDLVGSQYASLEITGWDEEDPESVDLDLFILNEDGEIYRSSTGTDYYETVTLPSDGTFYIAVQAYKGSSKYVLTVGTVFQGFQLSKYGSEVAIDKNKVLVSLKNKQADIASTDLLFDNELLTQKEKRKLKDSIIVREINDIDYLREYQIYQYKNKFYNNNFKITNEQIEDILFRKYINTLNLENEDLVIEPSPKLSRLGAFQSDKFWYYQWDHHAINLEAGLNALGSKEFNGVVAVIDDGSPPRNSQAWSAIDFIDEGYDFAGNDNDTTTPLTYTDGISDGYHGTHVASTIAAKNDSKDLNGMGLKVLPLKVFGGPNSGGFDLILEALKYAAGESNSSGKSYSSSQFPVKAINLSLGACGTSTAFCNEITNFIARTGIPVIASAGNCACNGIYSQAYCPVSNAPAMCEGVISVAASDAINERAYYSSTDETVKITAPGGDTKVDLNADGYADGVMGWHDGGIRPLQGTSMAAPHVSGAVALMRQINPDLTPVDIDNMILEGKVTDDIGFAGKDSETGYGLLNVIKAVEEASLYESSGSNIVTTVNITPKILPYAFTNDSLAVTITKVGDGDLSIEGVYADETDGWTYSGPQNLDYGTYTFTVDRNEYPEGSYQNSIYFGMSDGSYELINVSFSVGSPRDNPNLGMAYVLLIDNDSDEVLQSVTVDITSGSGSYEFLQVDGSKNLRIVIGSDIDSDDIICGWGEFCDFMPKEPGLDSFKLEENLTNVNFSMIPVSSIKFQSLSLQQTGKTFGMERKLQ